MHEVIHHTLQRQDRQILYAAVMALLLGLLGFAVSPLLSLALVFAIGIALLMFLSPYMALLLFLILLYTRPADYIPALQPFMLTKLTAIVCLAAWFITSLIVQRQRFISTRESKWLFAFLGAIFVSMISSENIDFSFNLFFDKFFKIIVLFILITNLVDTRRKMETLVWVLIGLAMWNGYLGISNYFTGKGTVGDLGRTQLVGIMGDPNDLALSMVIIIPFMIGIAANTSSGWLRLFLYAGVIELSYANLLTMSRGGLMGQIAALGAMFLVGKKRGLQLVSLALAVVLMLGVMTNAVGLRGADEGAEESGNSRLWLWEGGVRMALKSPVWGQGFGNFPLKIADYSDMPVGHKTAHSIWFLVIGELGFLGITTFCGFIIFSMLKAMQLLRLSLVMPERSAFRGILKTLNASLVGFLVCGSFLSQSYEWFLYILSAIVVAAFENLTPEERLTCG